MSPQYSSLQSGVDVGVIGIGDGVNVAVGVLVGVRIGVRDGVEVGGMGVSVLVYVLVTDGGTVVVGGVSLINTLDGSGRLTIEKVENPLT